MAVNLFKLIRIKTFLKYILESSDPKCVVKHNQRSNLPFLIYFKLSEPKFVNTDGAGLSFIAELELCVVVTSIMKMYKK